MNGGNLFQVLLASIRSKITPIVTKVRLWTSWNFIRTQLILKIRSFFASLLDVKPRHKKDYYEILGWLVSKRLAVAVLVVVGVLSLYYLFSINHVLSTAKTEGIKTYSYNSLQLRFANGKVRINGKSGYLAYEGEVSKGTVTGFGTLYNPQGNVVYQGNFDKNKYQGSGVSYYSNGTMQYNGAFTENLFDGTGKLYRENGSLAYEGDFALGKKEGMGILYDTGSNPIYSGSFSQDELLYSALLGMSVSEVVNVYAGNRILYENDEDFAVVLGDIGAIYLGKDNSQMLDDEMTVERVIVLKDSFPTGGKSCTTIEDLRQYFGSENYEGNSDVTMPEAVAFNCLDADKGGNKVEMNITPVYDDYIQVDDWDDSYVVYLYSFEKDGLVYTFVCEDRNAGFSFYAIEREEGGAA